MLRIKLNTGNRVGWCGAVVIGMLLNGCGERAELTPTPTAAPPKVTVQSAPADVAATLTTDTPAPAPPTAVLATTATPTATVEPTAVPIVSIPNPTAQSSSTVPPPTLFDVAWEDRSVFRPGLITTEQVVLEQWPGASVYHINLQLAEDLVNLQGREEVLYTNNEAEPLNELYVRLFPNLADGTSTVAVLKVNDLAVEPSYELRDSAMRVPLSPALQPDEQVVIQMEFDVKVPDGEGGNYGTFAYLDNVLALAHFYPMIAVYDDEGWNIEIAPSIGDVVYADTSFYLVRVAAPPDQTLVASGIEISRESINDQQVVTFAAGPMRDFYLAASDRYTVASRTVGQTTLHSYAPAEFAAGSDIALDHAEDALQNFNDRFGPYPYTEFDMVSTTTFALGVEYPGIVAILVDLYDPDSTISGTPTSPLLESTIAHEVAHQWFYSVVGNDQVDEPWLDEALAQFATLLYFSDVYGPTGANGFRNSLERRWNRADRVDIPIGMPVRAYTVNEYSAIVYGRGPLFVEALAKTMGQEAFAEFLKDYYQTFQWNIATGDDFKQLAERHCACDLTPLFEAWVYDK